MEEKEKTEKDLGGRPTLYKPDMPARLRGYIRDCPDKLPSIPGFALTVGVCQNTIRNWATKHSQFMAAYKELATAQHYVLLNKGVTGEYNSTITKLILSSNHGYKERLDKTSGDEPLKPKIIVFKEKQEQEDYVDSE